MYYFRCPEIVYGEDAITHLNHIEGRRAFIVTDAVIAKLGFVDRVQQELSVAGIESAVFSDVEPDPSLETARRGATQMLEFEPDWIIGLGGGSSMDAAKGMWVAYEQPERDLEGISPLEPLGLRQKARLITIPTTSGTGSEVTWAVVLTNKAERRKLGLASPELIADIAIVDPHFTVKMPPRVTADTGMDAMTQAIEAYTNTWHNDYTDGPALMATKLVFDYLPRAYADGNDLEAREKMHNAATIAGIAWTNGQLGLPHSMGHALGAVFHVPHGRAVSLFLPYVIEFCVQAGGTRYGEVAAFLGHPADSEEQGAANLVAAVRELQRQVDQPLTIAACGIGQADFERDLDHLVDITPLDSQYIFSPRVPDSDELRRLYWAACRGETVDF